MANIKVKFKEAYQDFGAYALLKNVTDKGVLIVDGTEVLNSIADLPTTNTVDGQEKAVIVQNGQVVTTSINNIGGGGGGGIAIGDAITDADAASILYVDGSGNLTQDTGFTRDVTTGNTNILATTGTNTFGFKLDNNVLGAGLSGSVLSASNTGGDSLISGLFNNDGALSWLDYYTYSSGGSFQSFKSNGLYSFSISNSSGASVYQSTPTTFSLISSISSAGGQGISQSGRVTVIGNTGGNPGGNDTKITIDDVTQLITVSNVPTYADDAAAATGGLTTGQLYKTTTLGTTSLNIVP